MVGKVIDNGDEPRLMDRDDDLQSLHQDTFVYISARHRITDRSEMVEIPHLTPKEFAGAKDEIPLYDLS